MLRNVLTVGFLAAFTLATFTTQVRAQRPAAESLLPNTTKGFFSVGDVDLLLKQWDKTQLGQLMNDPVMKPFVEDLRRQINNKLSKIGVRLGLTWKDLEGVYGGEVCLATIQPPEEKVAPPPQKGVKKSAKGTHAMALLVDITGHQKQAEALLEKLSQNLTKKGGVKKRYKVEKVGEEENIVVVYEMPKKDKPKGDNVCYATVNNFLIATDHLKTAVQLMQSAAGNGGDSLADSKQFGAVMKRVGSEADKTAPHVRWFVEPLGFAQVSRAASGGRKKRGTDILKVLAQQGFTAVQGVGGYVNFMTENDHEMLHRTFIYAPTDKRAKNNDRYILAARMLDFPNSNGDSLKAQGWIPRAAATYLTFNWKMKEAFEYSSTLIDALAGNEGTFESVLDGLKNDPKGPRVNIRKDLIAHVAERATLLTDYRLPITTKSERTMLAIELKNAPAVLKSLKKIMGKERKANKIEFKGHIIWEIINEDEDEENDIAVDLQVGGPGFGFPDGTEPGDTEDVPELNIVGPGGFGVPIDDDTLAQQPGPAGPGKGNGKAKKKKFMPRAAVTVAHGHLILATHVDFVKDMLTKAGPGNNLAVAADYKLVNIELDKLGGGLDSFRSFARTDEANRPTYELLREGKMPESETMFGKLLNRMLTSEDEEGLREQQIDGTKLPKYPVVRRYFGPAGLYVRSEEDGWLVVGCLLKK